MSLIVLTTSAVSAYNTPDSQYYLRYFRYCIIIVISFLVVTTTISPTSEKMATGHTELAWLNHAEPTFISSVVLNGSWATLSTSTINTFEMTGGGAESFDDISASDGRSFTTGAAAGAECLLDSLPRLLNGSVSETTPAVTDYY